jgi:hypothetical protein
MFRRILLSGVACALASLGLVAGAAQARGPKPKQYEMHLCVPPEPCGVTALDLFPKTGTFTDGGQAGSYSTHKIGHKTYGVFLLSLGGGMNISYEWEGVKDATGYSSQANPGTFFINARGEHTAVGTFWMIKI